MTKIEAKIYWAFLPLLLVFTLLVGCSSSRLEKTLSPEEKEFLSTVRYTITPEERKIFLQLPSSERKNFMEEFWKRRDPVPETTINEFKEEYFIRINQANKLFSEGGKQGWLSDRGRIWVTLGPPDHRETYPRGQSFYGFPVEIWHYGFYQIYFIDRFWNGNYQLDPASAQQIAEITQTQVNWNQPGGRMFAGSRAMDFEVRLERVGEGQGRIVVSLPYNQIWLKARQDRLETVIEVKIEIEDSAGKKIREDSRAVEISLTPEELKDRFNQTYDLEFQSEISGQGPFSLTVTVNNKTENKKSEKKLKFDF
ncbi:MAG: GWxTD domain-containing protein [Candidatus Saccharicenans sp.]|jgi:GWxTD domain-containing protein|nr:GWxTD domain-containing protein [Candidatus Saccharicenans sp.]MDH7494063.1 GWxTD domain-containing protein [Candidatus Saccharicenans sp.]